MLYTNAKKWEFSHLDKEACAILNDNKYAIESLKTREIHILYNIPKSISPLNA
jgi:hypothetical protein